MPEPSYLLDTHVIIWWLTEPAKLSPLARDLLEDDRVEMAVSHVCMWEMAIKAGLGKLPLPAPLPGLVPTLLRDLRGTFLPIRLEHTLAVADLPRHHGDPFDRLLIVQALATGLPVLGRDGRFDEYGVSRAW